MSRITIEAFEDRTRADGGHAVILLAGLKELPIRPAFRLRPAGYGAEAELPPAWPDGLLLPATTKVTGRGVEIVVGPDIAENPLLTAGSVVEIAFADADIKGAFLWPSIQPMARQRRRSVVARSPQRDERPDPMRQREQPAAAFNGGHGAPHSPAVRSETAPIEVPARAQPSRPTVTRHELPTSAKEQTAMSDNVHDAVSSGAAVSGGAGQQRRENAEFVTFYPHARGGRLKADKPARRSHAANLATLMPTTPGGVAAVIVAGVILVQGVMHLLHGGSGTPKPQTPTAAVAAIDSSTIPIPQPDALFEALVSGTTSPRGVNAQDIPGPRTLETAQTLLLGPDGARDTDEGAFWLKRYLQGALGDDRTLRALTHLGSTYAEPAGRAPDFAKARLVWEMAGALGDPVAMCLLGVVHENGLGVARDKKRALPWYERAKKAGGCPDIDESLARTRQ